MRNLIDLIELEAYFNSRMKEINDCFCSFTPQARHYREALISKLSDIEFIKDISYSFKIHIQNLLDIHHISEKSLMFHVNESIFELEVGLVNLAKYNNKITCMTDWFHNYSKITLFIIKNGKVTTSSDNTSLVQEDASIPLKKESKTVNFSHLL